MKPLTIEQAAKVLAGYIAKGLGRQPLMVHQWEHGIEPVTHIEFRQGLDCLEIYSGSDAGNRPTVDQEEDLIGDLDDLI